MQVIGEQHLQNNSYKSIHINEDRIKIQGNQMIIESLNNTNLYELQNLSDEKQISKIIDYFITTNSVGGVIYGCSSKEGKSITIVSTDGKPLVIDTQIKNEDLEKILKKYYQDRLKKLNEKEYQTYTLSSKLEESTMYNVDGNNIEFSLAHKNTPQGIYTDEIDFINELIEKVFEDEIIGVNSEFIKKADKDIFTGYTLESQDSFKKIKLNNLRYYNYLLVALICNHNCEVNYKRKQNINKQLKMEEF